MGTTARPVAAAEVDTRPSADQLLQRLEQTYQQASSYGDQGRIVLRYRQQGDMREDSAPMSVAMQRPGQARIEAYRAVVVCDGGKLYARVVDPMSNDIDGQILARDLQTPLSLDDIYRDGVLREALTSGLGGRPIQLDLLLGQSLRTRLAEGTAPQLLPSMQFDANPCHRVAIETSAGQLVLWIDQQSYLLRRVDYPAAAVLPELAKETSIRDLELVAEFRDARVGDPIAASRFQFPLPRDAKLVRAFVLPPHPLPSQLFGARPDPFVFQDLESGQVSRDDLLGKISVLLWFNNHPACRITLEQLNAVYAEQARSEDVRFYAISTEPSNVSNADLISLLREWNAGVPLLRDVQAFGRDVFQIPWAPTLVVMAPNGAVQIFEVGANPNLARELPVILERLKAGNDLAAEIVAAHAKEREEYQRLLEVAQNDDGADAIELALARILPRSEPQRLQLQLAWEDKSLTLPGNLTSLESDHATSILVIDGGTDVTALSTDGRVLSRHKLPAENRISRVRVATDADGGRIYLACDSPASEVYQFDTNWKLLSQYPAPHERHPHVVDFQVADLDADGQLEMLLGLAETGGVRGVTLSGTQKWRDDAMPNVLSLALSWKSDAPARSLLVTGERGDVLRIDGKSEHQAVQVDGRSIFHLFTSSLHGEHPAPYCGLTYSEAGNFVALGLDRDLKEVWSYPLPPGAFRNPIEFVTSGRIGEHPYWCVAAPDGTIHWIRADGHTSDNFAYGEELRGILLVDGLMLVTTRGGVRAWRVTAPENAQGNAREAAD